MKYIRGTEAPFMSKELHKAIMKISRLRNRFLNIEPILTKKTTAPKKSHFELKNLILKILTRKKLLIAGVFGRLSY